jgi:hypothetical protein
MLEIEALRGEGLIERNADGEYRLRLPGAHSG